MFVYPTDHTQ